MMDNNLLCLRKLNNIKGTNVAKIIGVTPCTYSLWEHGKIPIPTRRLIELANFYNTNIDYILNLTTVKRNIRKKTTLDLVEIGLRIKKVRENLGLSLRKLGKTLNHSFSALSSYERGKYTIQSDVLVTLAKKTNYSVDWILGRGKRKFIANKRRKSPLKE